MPVSQRLLYIVIFAVAPFWNQIACAEQSENLWADIISVNQIQFFFYSIEGNNMEILRSEMERKGPVSKGGKRRFAETVWTISWSWQSQEGGLPDYKTSQLDFSAKIYLPHMTNSNQSQSLKESWSGMLQTLARHELQHVLHGHGALLEIKDLLRRISAESPLLNYKEVNSRIRSVITRAKQLDSNYDRSTQHGDLEGLNFG